MKPNKEKERQFNPFLVGIGSGLVAINYPLTKATLGNADYWHGTPVENVPSILEKGLRLEHAGKMKRLNSILAENTLHEALLNHVGPEHEEKAEKLFKEINDLIDNHLFSSKGKSETPEKALLQFIKNEVWVNRGSPEIGNKLKVIKDEYIKRAYPEVISYFEKNNALPNEELKKFKFDVKIASPEEIESKLKNFLSHPKLSTDDKLEIRKVLRTYSKIKSGNFDLFPLFDDVRTVSDIIGERISKDKNLRNDFLKYILHKNTGVKVSDSFIKNVFENPKNFHSYLDLKAKATAEIIKEVTGKKHHKELENDLKNFLKNRGKRIYFGYGPHTVVDWASSLNELEMALAKQQRTINPIKDLATRFLKTNYSMINLSTGGLLGLIKDDLLGSLDYKLKTRSAKKYELDLNKELELLKTSPEKSKLKSILGMHTGKGKNYQAVLRVAVGPKQIKTLGAMKDFPGFSLLTQSLYGFRETLGEYLPNYHPGRDISVAGNIRPGQIKEIHLIDSTTGDIKAIIKNTAFKNPRRKFMLKHTWKPLLTVGLGSALIAEGLGLRKKLFNNTGGSI